MPRVAVFLGGSLARPSQSFDVYVGVDRACLFLLDNGLPLDLAVGDFDSVSAEERARVRAAAGACQEAKPEKNDTDAELALKLVFSRWPDAQVTVYGAFGGRLDHTLSNLFLPSDPDLAPFMEQIRLADETNLVAFFPAGTEHVVEQEPGLTYIAFMPADEGRLTILDAKYPLTDRNFFHKKIYGSNEFAGKPIRFSIDKGYALVIQSKDGGVLWQS